MPLDVTFTGSLRLDEYEQAARTYHRPALRRNRLLSLLSLGFVWAVTAWHVIRAGGFSDALMRAPEETLLLIGAVSILSVIALYGAGQFRRNLQRIHRDEFGEREYRARLDDDRVSVAGGSTEWTTTWDGFTDHGETPLTFWLVAGSLLILPKRHLSPDEEIALREHLAARVVVGDPRKRGFEVVRRAAGDADPQ